MINIKFKSARKRIQKTLLKTRPLIKILTPVPHDDDKDGWERRQRDIVFRGHPFIFRIAFLEYKIEQITKSEFLKLQNQIEKDNIDEYFSSLIKPHNRWSEMVRLDWEKASSKLIPLEAWRGLISEFINFIIAVKKKMWVINLKGVARNGLKTHSTTLLNLDPSHDLMELDVIGH